MPKPIRIEVYSRPGCHLCDEAKAAIEPFRTRYALELQTVNVEDSAELEGRYGMDIPVIFIEGEEIFRHRVDAAVLQRKLETLWNR